MPPAGFQISNQLDGFEDNSSGASILVLQVPASIDELIGGLTTEALAKKKQEVIERNTIAVIDLNGERLQVHQFSPAHGFGFIKFTLILSLEKNKAVMSNVVYPETKGIMIIAKSLRPVDTTDKEAACIKILNAISTISVEAVGEVEEKKMDGSEAYQIIAG